MRLFPRRRRDRLEVAFGRAAAGASPGPLSSYLSVPPPGRDAALSTLPLLAIDLETTGLDPRVDDILAVGFVPVDGYRVTLAPARYLLVRTEREVGQSATIHGLTDDVVAAGVPLAEAMAAVLGALSGRVLLAHHAGIESDFLGVACERLWGAGLPVRAVDTMRLAERLLRRRVDEEVPAGALRLWAARERYGLPVGRAHHALADAISCAELYLAQVAELEDAAPPARADGPAALTLVSVSA